MPAVERVARHAALALLGLACIATALALTPGADAVAMGYDRFALTKELTALVLVLAAAVAWLAARRPPALDPAAACLIGVTALAALSLAGATNSLLGWRGLGVAIVTAAAYLVAGGLARDGARDALLAIAVTTGAAIAAAALGEAHGVLPDWSLDGRAPGGTEGNRNFMGHALVIVLPVALAMPALTRRRALHALGLVTLVLIAWALVLTRSRGAWLGAMTATAVTVTALAVASGARSGRPRALALALAALVVGVVAAVVVPNELAWRSRAPYAETLGRLADHHAGSGRGRVIQYTTTARIVASHPWLGVGPGNWSVAYAGHARADDPSHSPQSAQPVNRLPNSDWLGLAAERGVPAVLGLVAFAALLLAATWRDRAARGRAAALTGVLVALAVCGTFDAVLLRPTPALLAAVALAALAVPGRPLVTVAPWPARAAFAAALVALALAVLPATYRAHAASRVATRNTAAALERAARLAPDDYRLTARVAARAARNGNCAVALRWAHRTLASYPHHHLCRRIVADCATGTIETAAALSRSATAAPHPPRPPRP